AKRLCHERVVHFLANQYQWTGNTYLLVESLFRNEQRLLAFIYWRIRRDTHLRRSGLAAADRGDSAGSLQPRMEIYEERGALSGPGSRLGRSSPIRPNCRLPGYAFANQCLTHGKLFDWVGQDCCCIGLRVDRVQHELMDFDRV